MNTRDLLPTPYNLSAIEWINAAAVKLKEYLDESPDSELADILDDIENSLEMLRGPK